jgi:hypothetical protein
MSELIDGARARAKAYLEHELRVGDEDLAINSTIEATLPEEQEEEVQQVMFEEIQQIVSGIGIDLAQDGWTTEVNIVSKGGFMEIVFKESDETSFELVFSIGQHDGKKADGILPTGLSFDTEGVRFNVMITSSVNDRIFQGIGSYRGVLEVAKRIADEYLDRHFIALYRQAGSEL